VGLKHLLEAAHGPSFDAMVVIELKRLADNEESLNASMDGFEAEGVAVMTFPHEVGRALK